MSEQLHHECEGLHLLVQGECIEVTEREEVKDLYQLSIVIELPNVDLLEVLDVEEGHHGHGRLVVEGGHGEQHPLEVRGLLELPKHIERESRVHDYVGVG